MLRGQDIGGAKPISNRSELSRNESYHVLSNGASALPGWSYSCLFVKQNIISCLLNIVVESITWYLKNSSQSQYQINDFKQWRIVVIDGRMIKKNNELLHEFQPACSWHVATYHPAFVVSQASRCGVGP